MLSWNPGDKKKKAIFSILNGSEPTYDGSKWNDNLKIRKTHNCYAYMLDIVKKGFEKKPQPGYASGYSYLNDSDIRACDKMFERIRSDNPSLIQSKFGKPCPEGYRKGYLAVDDSANTDYHFYRLDDNGYWSHKPGATKTNTKNFDGKKITAPHKARRESNSHKYNKSCGYFCFDPKSSKLSNKPKNKIHNSM